MSVNAEMLTQATQVMHHAFAPYSQFKVGVCLRAEDDSLHAGCNVENASYSLTLCAEASAISQLISEGKKKITEALIISSGPKLCPPCGACRQRLWEFSIPDMLIHLYSLNGQHKTLTMEQLLPFPFGSENLEG